MTHRDFILWLRGFVTACNPHMPTPAQWDLLKDELDNVEREEKKDPNRSMLYTDTLITSGTGDSEVSTAVTRKTLDNITYTGGISDWVVNATNGTTEVTCCDEEKIF